MIQQAMKNNSNPQDILKQMIGNKDSGQIQQVLSQAKQMGVPDNILSQVQNLNR